MTLESFGYLGIRSDKLDEWSAYAPGLLGLELAERSGSQLRLRMDDRMQRIVVSSDPLAEDFFGWETRDGASLAELARRLSQANVAVQPLDASERDTRAIAEGIWFRDPAGNRLEVFHSPALAGEPFQAGRPISGFRTGSMGMGHVVFHVERIDDLQWFYQDLLGFRLSDFCVRPFKAFFFHLNPRHHSLALIETGRRGIHHVMMEVMNLDDVGQAYDIAQAESGRIGTTLGRHTNDFMTSFYARTPDSFMVEYGWGGRAIEPATWQAQEMHHGPSLWGHDRTWMAPEQLAEARAFRARVAAEGLREPVQVMAGNYQVAP
jgi:2,3-dihydroxybiphenyl 1,2-dioxygenase